VYELVKRRCQYIVVCDAGQDEHYSFEDLGNMIRKVRIDLGIRIEIAPDFLPLQKEARHCRWHCAIGKIRYDDVDNNASPGTLVYIKPSLTGDEPADVLNYAADHPSFPHETTANQFYTESQFESYRALGQHIGEAVFEQVVPEAKENMDKYKSAPELQPGTAERYEFWCRELFAALVRRWYAMPPEYESTFVEATHGFIDLQDAFRKDRRLWRLAMDMYPELDPTGATVQQASEETAEEIAARQTTELHVLLQMLQVMENAYLSLNLEVNYGHPMNRGWMNVFHRWTSAETFRLKWPLLRGEFGQDFIRFCERQMRLGVVKGKPIALRLNAMPHGFDRLRLEFEDQWDQFRGAFADWLAYAATDEHDSAWVIYPDNPYPLPGAPTPESGGPPVGIIFVRPSIVGDTAMTLPTYDFLVWLRGAYRNTGLGRPAVRDILVRLRKRWPNAFCLRVRLPVAGMTGPGAKLQKAMWLTFFHQLSFERRQPDSGSADAELYIVLQRVFPALDQGGAAPSAPSA
jgi:hypothetical protein